MAGSASPARLLETLRPSELGYWWAKWQVDPWGEERADLRAAIVASLIANVNRDPKRRPTPFRPEDFMPFRVRDAQVDQAALGKRLLATFGLTLDPTKVKRRKR